MVVLSLSCISIFLPTEKERVWMHDNRMNRASVGYLSVPFRILSTKTQGAPLTTAYELCDREYVLRAIDHNGDLYRVNKINFVDIFLHINFRKVLFVYKYGRNRPRRIWLDRVFITVQVLSVIVSLASLFFYGSSLLYRRDGSSLVRKSLRFIWAHTECYK